MVFGWLKKAFSSEPKITEKEVKIGELESWYSEELKDRFSVVIKRCSPFFDKIKREQISLKDKVEVLKEATLHNPKITVKEIQFMEGNRDAYIKKIGSFISATKVPEELDYKAINDYLTFSFEQLEIFNKSTVKPYYIIKEFFADKAVSIAESIRDIVDSLHKIQDVLKVGLDKEKFSALKAAVQDLNGALVQAGEATVEKDQLDKKKKELMKEKSLLEKLKKELVESKEYKRLESLEAERDQVHSDLKLLEDHLAQSFGSISSALKKYKRASDKEDLLQEYLDHPITALKKDSALSIVFELDKMGMMIKKHQLELKDKKQEKILFKLSSMNKKYFTEVREKELSLHDSYEELVKKVTLSRTYHSKHDIDYKLEHFNNQLEKISIKSLELDEFIKKRDIEVLKETVISKALAVGVKISII